ncbi:MAG: TerB family tellurite resistance protein [Gemmataceae bacterium]|nr:TerB family tellurite resistance protein [Gemmataceae bacterium]
MPQLRALMEKFLADGKVDGREVEALGDLLPPGRAISRAEADFLVELHRRVDRVTPAFERFFFQAIKRHVLTDGAIDPEEATWLRRMVLADGRVSEREKKLLRELRGEAARTCPEFEALLAECVK